MSAADRSYDNQLEALLALDALDADEQADAELRLGTFSAHAGPVSAVLGERVAAAPPNDLRDAMLDVARSRRPAGRVIGGATAATPLDGFVRTVADLHALLRSLTDEEWHAPAHEDHGSVRDLVAHLVGVERLSVRWLDPDDEVPELPDHVAATRAVVEELATFAPVRELADLWQSSAMAVADAALQVDPAHVVSFHGLSSDVDGFLAIRTFEHWAHSMDISVATGRRLLALDDERMLTLSRRLMNVVPVAMAGSETPMPAATVRFVLTGAAGGSYDVPLRLGDAPTDPVVTIVSTAHDLCKLATSRLPAGDLHPDIEGDHALADAVLVRMNALALD